MLKSTSVTFACALRTRAVHAKAGEAGCDIASLAALDGHQHQGEGEEEGLHDGNGYLELTDTDTVILMSFFLILSER